VQASGIAADSDDAWLQQCKQLLQLAQWLVTGDYVACVCSSAVGKAVLGAAEGDVTLADLRALPALTALLRTRVARYVLHGSDDGDAYANPAADSAAAHNNPVAFRAAAVVFLGAACLSLYMQVGPAVASTQRERGSL
jgi:hypothetical protein